MNSPKLSIAPSSSTKTVSHFWVSSKVKRYQHKNPNNTETQKFESTYPSLLTLQTEQNLIIEENATSTPTHSIVTTNLKEQKEAQDFRNGLIFLLDTDLFDFEKKSATELYVEQWLDRNEPTAKLELIKVFLSNRDNEKRLIGMLNILAHLDSEKFHPANEMIALGALSHKSNEVKECALRAYEYWENPTFTNNLRHHLLTPEWIEEYKKSIILDTFGE